MSCQTPTAVQHQCVGTDCWLLVAGRPACLATSAYSQPLPELPKRLEDVPLAVSMNVIRAWCAPAHFSCGVRDVLYNVSYPTYGQPPARGPLRLLIRP
jgi:hypothetical protein